MLSPRHRDEHDLACRDDYQKAPCKHRSGPMLTGTARRVFSNDLVEWT